MSDPRRGRLHRQVLLGLGGFALIVVVLVATMRLGRDMGLIGPARILAGTLGAGLMAVWGGVFAIRISRAQDEYQQWKERRSWYVGGLAGLLASLPAFAFIGLGGLHWLVPASDSGAVAARAFSNGYMLPVMMQVVGSTGFALWARFTRR